MRCIITGAILIMDKILVIRYTSSTILFTLVVLVIIMTESEVARGKEHPDQGTTQATVMIKSKSIRIIETTPMKQPQAHASTSGASVT